MSLQAPLEVCQAKELMSSPRIIPDSPKNTSELFYNENYIDFCKPIFRFSLKEKYTLKIELRSLKS